MFLFSFHFMDFSLHGLDKGLQKTYDDTREDPVGKATTGIWVAAAK